MRNSEQILSQKTINFVQKKLVLHAHDGGDSHLLFGKLSSE